MGNSRRIKARLFIITFMLLTIIVLIGYTLLIIPHSQRETSIIDGIKKKIFHDRSTYFLSQKVNLICQRIPANEVDVNQEKDDYIASKNNNLHSMEKKKYIKRIRKEKNDRKIIKLIKKQKNPYGKNNNDLNGKNNNDLTKKIESGKQEENTQQVKVEENNIIESVLYGLYKINDRTDLETEQQNKSDICGLSISKIPYVILRSGKKIFKGGKLNNDCIVDTIRQDYIILNCKGIKRKFKF